MIYIVSGFMRSGTSMMMKALMAGGLEGYYDSSRNVMNEQYGDQHYRPNEGGFFEPSKSDFNDPNFPKMHDWKLIKVLHGGIPKLPVFNYKVVVMRRHPEEIKQSYEGFFNDRPPKILDRYDEVIEMLIQHIENRKDMTGVVLNYRDVIENPTECFKRIGFPIDVEKATSVINPDLYRFRLERLTEGI